VIRDDGVGVVNGLVVFLIVWWLVIFTMLPIGVRSQEEAGEVQEGSEPGAPVAPMLMKKAWWTTIITSCIWIVYYIVTDSGLAAQYMPTDGSWG
jgi:predicted secreted protein